VEVVRGHKTSSDIHCKQVNCKDQSVLMSFIAVNNGLDLSQYYLL